MLAWPFGRAAHLVEGVPVVVDAADAGLASPACPGSGATEPPTAARPRHVQIGSGSGIVVCGTGSLA